MHSVLFVIPLPDSDSPAADVSETGALRCEQGNVYAEYVALITLVTLIGGIGFAKLGGPMFLHFRFAEGLLAMPF